MPTPKRRRIYLMRHGSVDYFAADGTPMRPDFVTLNSIGREQADAAGALFKQSAVSFDRVVVSGLARTVETAQRVLKAAGQGLAFEEEADWQEVRGGRLADIPAAELEQAFLDAFRSSADVESRRFLGGESIGQLLDRALPALERWRDRSDWQTLLLVLHGGVNRALLSYALSGQRAFFGRLEQQPACINVLDIGEGDDIVVRAINLAPTQWLQAGERLTTMEQLLAQYRSVA